MKNAVHAQAAMLLIGIVSIVSPAQQPPAQQGPQPFFVGNRLGMPINPAADGSFNAMSANVKVYGSIYSAESCSYDSTRGVIVVPNRGVAQNVQTNNAWVSFINHDGSVHTARWIGIQTPEQRVNLKPPLILNEPLGSDIANGMLYVADRDGGTNPNDPAISVVRRFNMQTGAPAGEIRVEKSTGFNDIEVADDGTIYATQGRSAAPAKRDRVRPARQHRRGEHRQRSRLDVLSGGPVGPDRKGRAGGQ
jgi:hypothetical protein